MMLLHQLAHNRQNTDAVVDLPQTKGTKSPQDSAPEIPICHVILPFGGYVGTGHDITDDP
jgi:hypothetical protein